MEKAREIKEIFNKEKPNKKLGQNFLINEDTVKKIIEAGALCQEDKILEIGPGLGVLTEKLIQVSKKVIAVEKDKKLVTILEEKFKEANNLEIIEEDILNFSPPKDKLGEKYKIISNLPFYNSTTIIKKFLEAEDSPKLMIVLLQKEVAERILAQKKESFLSILVKFHADSFFIQKVPRHFFWPKPKVEGVVIKIVPHQRYIRNAKFNLSFFKTIEAGFAHPRKQLKNNLSKLCDKSYLAKLFKKESLLLKKRAEDIPVEKWIEITENLFDYTAKKDRIK